MENRIISKTERKDQKDSLKEALNAEKSQFGAIRRLFQIDRDFENFELSDFQSAIVNNINEYFETVISQYSKPQKKKAKQAELKKQLANGENVELLTKTRYNVIYNDEITMKTFGSEKKAKEFRKSLALKNLKIEAVESEISSHFTPNEMLGILQKLEAKFFSTYSEPKAITVAMVKTAIGENLTKKDKENSKADSKAKTKLKKSA